MMSSAAEMAVSLLLAPTVTAAVLLLLPIALCLGVATLRGIVAARLASLSSSSSPPSSSSPSRRPRVISAAVVVLGDIGHSPRTANHAYSLATMSVGTARCSSVHIIAEGKVSSLHNKLKELFHTFAFKPPRSSSSSYRREEQQKEQRGVAAAEMRMHRLHASPELLTSACSRLPRALGKLVKAAYQSYALLIALALRAPRTDVAVLQLPPSVPTLPLCLLLFWLQRTRLLVDWHNFGYTLLSLSSGASHPLTIASRACERRLGGLADASICVTSAMRDVLASWGVRADVFYDRAPEHFRRSSVDEEHALFVKYGLTMGVEKEGALLRPVRRRGDKGRIREEASTPASSMTLVTEECFTMSRTARGGTSFGKPVLEVHLARNRPAVIVSSTSWTKDEDFSILLEAATIYERALVRAAPDSTGAARRTRGRTSGGGGGGGDGSHPDLLIVITGKGPEKEMYESQLRRMSLKHVSFVTVWLDAEDYPVLLGAADLGVSLHMSSSGVDLPMKVVDMFGCSLPACAARFDCIGELVHDGVDGRLFDDSRSLADLLLELLHDFPDAPPSMRAIQRGAAAMSERRWDDEWKRVVAPIVARFVT